jgi:hypothetical protein
MSEHAMSNARAWLADIHEMLATIEAAEEARKRGAADDAREKAQESVLSVQVRSGWHAPGAEPGEPEEYEILLTTGGPACRIIGRLGAYGQPDEWPEIQWQDWGTQWTRLTLDAGDLDALATFARLFYFGE